MSLHFNTWWIVNNNPCCCHMSASELPRQSRIIQQQGPLSTSHNNRTQSFSFQSSSVSYGGPNGVHYSTSATRRMGPNGVNAGSSPSSFKSVFWIFLFLQFKCSVWVLEWAFWVTPAWWILCWNVVNDRWLKKSFRRRTPGQGRRLSMFHVVLVRR